MGSYSAQRKSNIVPQKTKDLLERNLVEQKLKSSLDTPKIFTKKTFHGNTKEIFDQQGIDYDNIFPKIMRDSLHKLSLISPSNNFIEDTYSTKIPLITHQGYLSFKGTPTPIKQSSVDETVRSLLKCNEVGNFRHIIWTNNPSVIPEKISSIKGVEVHLIDELNFPTLNLLEIQGKVGRDIGKFSMASDSFRARSIELFGGFYRDMDAEIYDAQRLVAIAKNHDAVFGIEHDYQYSLVGSAFFGAKASHPIVQNWVQYINRNINDRKNGADLYKYTNTKFDAAIFLTGPGAANEAFYKGYNKNGNNDLIVPPKVFYNAEYAWYLDPTSRCHSKVDVNNPPSLVNKYKDITTYTIAADKLCGDWQGQQGYQTPIKYFDDNNSLEIVISRYNENLDWIRDTFAYSKVTVYNKGPNNLENLPYNVQVINLPNVGRESHTYLYHVIMNYDNIAGRTVFLQGDPFFHAPNLKRFIEGSPSSCSNTIVELMNGDGCHIKNLGDLSHELSSIDWKNSKWSDTRLSDETLLEFARHNINPSFNANSPISHIPGGQFAVDKENILCHSVDFHKKLYDYFDHDRSPIEGHYMERLWNEWANCDNQG